MNKGMKAGEEREQRADSQETGEIPGKCHRGERNKSVTEKR